MYEENKLKNLQNTLSVPNNNFINNTNNAGLMS
jgi:hypothetical protein